MRWDELFFILITTGMVTSPALLMLVWAWLSKIPKVKKLLVRGFLTALSAPIMIATLFAVFRRICERGHLDQQFGACSPVPDIVANLTPVGLYALLVSISAFIAIYCLYLEINRLRAVHKKAKQKNC
ncbi:MAG: hypothetical protein GQ535_06725 [Rhodobacteraceae bacterium]|nr:hypothetical protein [Paracoccaceae bacterium]